jgi:hypothetical protein
MKTLQIPKISIQANNLEEALEILFGLEMTEAITQEKAVIGQWLPRKRNRNTNNKERIELKRTVEATMTVPTDKISQEAVNFMVQNKFMDASHKVLVVTKQVLDKGSSSSWILTGKLVSIGSSSFSSFLSVISFKPFFQFDLESTDSLDSSDHTVTLHGHIEHSCHMPVFGALIEETMLAISKHFLGKLMNIIAYSE